MKFDVRLSINGGKSILDSQVSDRERCIPYRPEYNFITGCVEASILLQQMYYWWVKNERAAFYKFNEPCKSIHYREGDSWMEEVGFTRDQFIKARDSIAIKISKGVSKTKALEISPVIYWTDSNRVTWYEVSEKLLYRLVYCVYRCKDLRIPFESSGFLCKSELLPYLDNIEKQVYILSETTQENNNKRNTKELRAVGAQNIISDSQGQPQENDDKLVDLYIPVNYQYLGFGKSQISVREKKRAIDILKSVNEKSNNGQGLITAMEHAKKELEELLGIPNVYTMPREVIGTARIMLQNPEDVERREKEEELAKQNELAEVKTKEDEMRGWLYGSLFDLAIAFVRVTGFWPKETDRSHWIKAFSELHDFGAQPLDVRKAVNLMRNKGLLIKSPFSIKAQVKQLRSIDKQYEN